MIWLSDDGPLVFLVLTVVIGGGAAYLSARGLALGWRAFWQVAAYMLLLAAAVRFFHYALFDGELFSAYYYLVTYLVLLAIAGLAYRLTRTTQMVTQYPWLYERSSPLSWRNR